MNPLSLALLLVALGWVGEAVGAPTTSAHAGEGRTGPSAPETAEGARALLAAHGLTVRAADGGAIAAGTLETLAEGLLRLPPRMRTPPGGPLELRLHDERQPYGMGASAAARWSNGRERFHLYRLADRDAAHPERNADRMSDAARERLWQQRALVHAVVQRWDDAQRWNHRHAWRRIAGWRFPFEGLNLTETPRNVFAGAYSRPLGSQSASLDLVTFAEEHFVPVEALSPGAVSADARVACQEFTKTRALNELMQAAGLLETRPASGNCPAFERWARPESLEGIEVLLVAASGRNTESIFGHLLMRPVYRDDGGPVGPGMATVIQLAALAENESAGLRRIWRGLTGGYLMTVFTLPYSDLVEEALHDEQRTIRRYRVQLDHEAQRRVLERAWELERRGYFPYTFLTDNCAALLAFLLEPALPEDARIRFPGAWLVSPSSTLDALAKVKIGEGATAVPLIAYVPGDLEATRERAERSERERHDLEAALRAHLSPEAAARWKDALSSVRSLHPAIRGPAFHTVAALSREAPPEADPLLHAWWAHAARVERDRVERARHALLALARKTLLDPGSAGIAIEQELAMRQEAFANEERLATRAMLVDRTEAERQRLARLPHRPDTEAEATERAQAQATLALFTEVTRLQGALGEERFERFDGSALLTADAARAATEDEAWKVRAQRGSGAWRFALGGTVRAPLHGGPATPLVHLRTSVLAETLGDQRLHGFQPEAELRVLDGWSHFTLGSNGWPRVVQSHLTLFGYRTLVREAPHLRKGLLDEIGHGFAIEFDRRPERAHAQRAQGLLEVWLPVEVGPRLVDFSAFSLGAALGAQWGDGPLFPAAGPRLAWRGRTGLDPKGPSALRFEAHAQSSWLLGGGPPVHEFSAEAGVELFLGTRERPIGLLNPKLGVTIDAVGSGPTRPVASFTLSFEPLR